jgi:osmotically inducible protein OsmC
MPVTSTANAEWTGPLKEGSGKVSFGTFKGEFTRASRFETGQAGSTNPEQLIAAGHASCFSMQLSGLLTADGHPPKSLQTKASVTVEAGVGITTIVLETVGEVPGIDAATFTATANKAKEVCPVSRALAGVKDVSVKATLK